MLSKSLLHATVVISSCTLVAGCFDSKSSKNDGPPPTRFSLAVTDAPIDDAQHVVVEFSTVVLQPSDSERIEFRLDEPMRVDLLALQGLSSQYLVMDKEVPAGDYDWIRLGVNAHLDGVMDSYIELRSGAQLELVIPSGDETGLKLNGGFVLQEGAEADFTIDFDLRRSIAIPAHIDTASAVLRPSLRMVDTVFSGSIEGEIESNIVSRYCEDANLNPGAVYIFDYTAEPGDVHGTDEGPLASALVHYRDGGYYYEAGFIPQGSYNVLYTCDAAFDSPDSEEDLQFVPAHAEVGTTTVTLAENVVLNFPSDAQAQEPFTPETNNGTEQDPPATDRPEAEPPAEETSDEDFPATEVPIAEPPAEPGSEQPVAPGDYAPTAPIVDETADQERPAEEAPEQTPPSEQSPVEQSPVDQSPAEPQLPVVDVDLPIVDELIPSPAPATQDNNGRGRGNQAEQPDHEQTDGESESEGKGSGRGKGTDKDKKDKGKDNDEVDNGRSGRH